VAANAPFRKKFRIQENNLKIGKSLELWAQKHTYFPKYYYFDTARIKHMNARKTAGIVGSCMLVSMN
jgi:hypothetical protein